MIMKGFTIKFNRFSDNKVFDFLEKLGNSAVTMKLENFLVEVNSVYRSMYPMTIQSIQ
jgi:hypothetical protein